MGQCKYSGNKIYYLKRRIVKKETHSKNFCLVSFYTFFQDCILIYTFLIWLFAWINLLISYIGSSLRGKILVVKMIFLMIMCRRYKTFCTYGTRVYDNLFSTNINSLRDKDWLKRIMIFLKRKIEFSPFYKNKPQVIFNTKKQIPHPSIKGTLKAIFKIPFYPFYYRYEISKNYLKNYIQKINRLRYHSPPNY